MCDSVSVYVCACVCVANLEEIVYNIACAVPLLQLDS